MPNDKKNLILKNNRPIDIVRRDLYGPEPLDWQDVPPDLHERPVQNYMTVGGVRGYPVQGGRLSVVDSMLPKIADDVRSIASTTILDRGLIGRVVLVPSTPVEIINSQFVRGYLLLNPALTVGLTAVGSLFTSQSITGLATVNSSTLGVANYNTLRLMLNVTSFTGTGTVTFDAQTLDPVDTVTWITSQTVFSVTGTTTNYANLGGFGVDTDFRISVSVPAGVSITFNLRFVLKDGLEGTSTGAAQTIFIGPAGVTPDVGFPLLPGQEKRFYVRENLVLFAVTSGPTLPLRIFEL